MDRTETQNLAAERPELVQQMDAAWLAWWKDCTGNDWTGKAPKELKDGKPGKRKEFKEDTRPE